MEKAIRTRGVVGDRLLDCLDIIEDVKRVGGEVTGEGRVILYHATTEESARKIAKEARMYGKEDGLFFSTKADGQVVGYGDYVVKVEVPVENLILDDEFNDEQHYRVPLDKKGEARRVDILGVERVTKYTEEEQREREINARVYKQASARLVYPNPKEYGAERQEKAQEYDKHGEVYGFFTIQIRLNLEEERTESFVIRDTAQKAEYLEAVRKYNRALREIQEEELQELPKYDKEMYLDFNWVGEEIGIIVKDNETRNRKQETEIYTGENERDPGQLHDAERRAEGPYGGAFSSWDDYYRYRGAK